MTGNERYITLAQYVQIKKKEKEKTLPIQKFTLYTFLSVLSFYMSNAETKIKSTLLFHLLLFIFVLTIVFMVHLDILKPCRARD